ncbi:MAG: TOBE domain-containing protein, partial [Alphaproteobacteria bacterium]
ADRIVLLRDGVIEQQGAPLELYEKPVNKFVAGFLGSPAMNFIPATVEADGEAPCFRLAGDVRLRLPPARAGEFSASAARKVLLGIRPEHMHRQREGAQQAGFEALPVRIEIVEPMGANTLINFHIGETSVLARLDAYADEQPGTELTLLVDMNRAVVVDPESEMVI